MSTKISDFSSDFEEKFDKNPKENQSECGRHGMCAYLGTRWLLAWRVVSHWGMWWLCEGRDGTWWDMVAYYGMW